MRPATHLRFVSKACAAMVSAVELYNKPSFQFRDEAFCILAINAWELLIKAKVVKNAGNDVKSLPLRTKIEEGWKTGTTLPASDAAAIDPNYARVIVAVRRAGGASIANPPELAELSTTKARETIDRLRAERRD